MNNAQRARSYAAQLRKQAEELPAKVAMPAFRRRVFKVLEVAIQNTPVNIGNLRNGWHLTIGTRSGRDTGKPGTDPSEALREGERVINQVKFGETLVLQNNDPKARIYEDGLFVPANPGPTDWSHIPNKRIREQLRKQQPNTVLIQNGYHVNAPTGMLRDAVQVVAEEIRAGRL